MLQIVRANVDRTLYNTLDTRVGRNFPRKSITRFDLPQTIPADDNNRTQYRGSAEAFRNEQSSRYNRLNTHYIEGLLFPVALHDYNVTSNTVIMKSMDELDFLIQNVTAHEVTPGTEADKHIHIGSIVYDKRDISDFQLDENWIDLTQRNAIKSLYDMASRQAALRDGIDPDLVKYKLFQLRTDQTKLLLVTNLIDGRYASEWILTAGVLPLVITELHQELTAIEREYFKMLATYTQTKRPDKQAQVNELHSRVFNQEYIRNLTRLNRFSDLKNNLINNRKRGLEQNIENVEQRINSAEQSIERLYGELRQYKQVMFGLEYDEGSIGEGLAYLTESDYLQDLEYIQQNDALVVTIKAPMNFISNDEMESFIRGIRRQGDERLANLFQQLYIEGRGYFIAASKFTIYLRDHNCSVERGFDPMSNGIECIGNPHHSGYHCLGDYEIQIKKAARSLQFDVLHDVLLASTRNFNVADGTVASSFKEQIRRMDERDIQTRTILMDGEQITVRQAMSRSNAPRVEEPVIEETVVNPFEEEDGEL